MVKVLSNKFVIGCFGWPFNAILSVEFKFYDYDCYDFILIGFDETWRSILGVYIISFFYFVVYSFLYSCDY